MQAIDPGVSTVNPGSGVSGVTLGSGAYINKCVCIRSPMSSGLSTLEGGVILFGTWATATLAAVAMMISKIALRIAPSSQFCVTCFRTRSQNRTHPAGNPPQKSLETPQKFLRRLIRSQQDAVLRVRCTTEKRLSLPDHQPGYCE